MSNPVSGSFAGSGAHLRSGASQTSLAYVFLPPDSIPDGQIAVIRNPRSGSVATTAMADGGFDPVPVVASAGDRLELEIQVSGGGPAVRATIEVPEYRKPRVVRTRPIKQKRDVVLNAILSIVFSEPIDPSTVGAIRLLRGTTPVSGRAVLSADGLRAEFQPAQLLTPNTGYQLLIPVDIADLSGDPLQSAVVTEFTTGTTVAEASVATQQAALFINPNSGTPRTMDFSAQLLDDGRVTGSYHIFYPETGFQHFGRVICFATDGNAAWIAGVVDSATNPDVVGTEFGWRAVDHGPPDGGVPDQLSLAHPMGEGGVRSAQEWCATTPITDPWYGEIVLYELVSGDIVVTGDAPIPPPPPPPPPPPHPADGMSQIAFFSPGGAIQVVTADGSGLRRLTSGPDQANPAWSPDGMQLAFQSHRLGESDIYAVNWDGSGLTQLTSGPETDQDPAWSPDGAMLAFLRNGSIHVMNADGSGVTRVSFAGFDSHPSWSPDGSRIVFASSRSGVNAIHVMNADGSGVVQLTNDSAVDYSPSWSPDGSKIVFQRNPYGVGSIYLMNPDGTGLTRLVGGQTPSWSPDGRRIIYELFGLTFVMADGSGMTRLGNGFAPDWSPVGTMPPEPSPFRSVEIAGGDGQTGSPGTTLSQPLSVRVVGDNGAPQPGVTIRWNVWWGGQAIHPSLSSNVVETDSSGISSVRLTLGGSPGQVRVRAALTDGTARKGEVLFLASAVVEEGALHVTARSTGAADLNGYELILCRAGDVECRSAQYIPVNGEATISGLRPGDYTMTLGGVADYCAVNGPNPRTVSIVAYATAEVSVDVACRALEVLVPYGAAGYRFKVLTDWTSSGGGFELPGFDDAAAGFADGTAAFSSGHDECPDLSDSWKTHWPVGTDLLLRKAFEVPSGVGNVRIRVAIDDAVQVFLNGVDITAAAVPSNLGDGFQWNSGCAIPDGFVFTPPDAALHQGSNLLALRARDGGVVSFVDVRVTAERN